MEELVFVILSFEGPDAYSHAGGLGSRVSTLSEALAAMHYETHLFFIGDPYAAGHQIQEEGRLHLHRWCQWISAYHPAGVYDGEEGKLNDWNQSLPPWLAEEIILPHLKAGKRVVILAEEWHTVSSILYLHHLLVRLGCRDQVTMLWNANNTFGFHRIPWGLLKQAATITTVSRYMKHLLWDYGAEARIIPNGIHERWLQPMDASAAQSISNLFKDRLAVAKVARWDPDKRWDMAVDAVASMKQMGLQPLFLARGGLEAHGGEVVGRAKAHGLHVAMVQWADNEVQALADLLRPALGADMIVLESYLSEHQRKQLFFGADAVLANSGVEPFGLVGLETMATGGVAFVGCTGEDYATPGYDAIAIQSNEPGEIVHHLCNLKRTFDNAFSLRRAAKNSASRYTWPAVIRRVLIPLIGELSTPLERICLREAANHADHLESQRQSEPPPLARECEAYA